MEIPNDLDRLARDKYERDALQITQDIANFSSKKLEGIKTNLSEIAASKTKGGLKNLVAIMDTVGQQTLAGERFVPQLMNGKVCFNFFSPENKSLEARGFCDRSYSQGLTVEQYTMHGSASREQLVNVSVSTRFVGYDHRGLVRKNEDLITDQDGSVRDKGILIQQAFGGHSLNLRIYRYLQVKIR